MLHPLCSRSTVVAFLLLATSPAQEPAAKPDPAAKLAVLRKALQKMEALQSCSFTCRQYSAWNAANLNALVVPQAAGRVAVLAPAQPAAPAVPAQPDAPAPAPAPVPPGGGAWRAVPAAPAAPAAAAPTVGAVSATWSDGLLFTTSSDGRDQVVAHGRRTIARQGDGPWLLRQGLTNDGQPLPKTIDPDTFFAALANAKLELVRAEVGSLDDKPVEVVTVHAGGEDAYDLLLSGLLPDATTVARAGSRAAARGGMQLEVDVAVWLDPATARVQQVKVRCYTNARNAPQVAGFAVGPNGLPGARILPVERQAEAEEDAQRKPAEAQPAEPPAFKDGLPVRTAKAGVQLNVVSCDVVFANHDSAKAPGLDARARELLRLPAGK